MGAERAFADQKIDELKIRLGSPFQPASALSGGTQQKVVLGKFMARQPSVLLFVDPTRGIDVQTKFSVYEMIRDLARRRRDLRGLLVGHRGAGRPLRPCRRVPRRRARGASWRVRRSTQDAVVAASFAVAREASS